MKKTMIALVLSVAPLAQATGIASGQPTGTNYPMAEDIVKVCSKPGAPITNVVSDGALDNIYKIYGDKLTQYGVIPTDALMYQKGIDPRMMENIKMVFPFFSAEMHLIVRADSPINTLADLAGKRVVEGPEGSGTWVSVQVIKSLTGSNWNTQILSQKAGMDAVLKGTADAEFIVAGRPITMLDTAKGIKLIPLNHPKLDGFGLYTKTMIPSNSYPFQKTSVSTYKVDTVLATYAFKNQYQKEIGDLVTCIVRNMPRLQSEGHPKWKDVRPEDLERIKWPSHPAALRAIKNASK